MLEIGENLTNYLIKESRTADLAILLSFPPVGIIKAMVFGFPERSEQHPQARWRNVPRRYVLF